MTTSGSIPAVECRDLVYRFGAVRAVDGISFAVEPGEVFGLLGPNGAGKTTTIRVLTTLLKPDVGSARVFGLDVATRSIQVRRLLEAAGQPNGEPSFVIAQLE